MDDRQKCGNCLYFVGEDKDRNCTRFPPQRVFNYSGTFPGEMELVLIVGHTREDKWCGEWAEVGGTGDE